MQQIVNDLRRTIRDAIHHRDVELERLRAEYDATIRELQQALNRLEDGDRSDTLLSVSEERLHAVRQFVLARADVRQADISKALGINSGSVSVALRRLQLDGIVEPAPFKRAGSQVWRRARVRAVV